MTLVQKVQAIVRARGGKTTIGAAWAVSGGEITRWDEAVLGARPTQEDLDAATLSVADTVAAGEAHVAGAGLTAARLVTLFDALMEAKQADALASKPKLVALYTWLKTVKGMAVAGMTAFPPAPHTFEEVVAE